MNTIRFSYVVALLCLHLQVFSQSNTYNSDFEAGDFTGWTAANGLWGDYTKGTGVDDIEWKSFDFVDGRQTIISKNTNDYYTCGNLPTLPPEGGDYVARLGNPVKGAQLEVLSYKMTVDKDNALFLYRYAVVFEDPGHTHEEQPYFQLEVKDQSGTIIDPLCGYNRIVSGAGITGFETCSLPAGPGGKKATTVRWKPWTTVAMDLTPYIGQTIDLVFTNADCAKGGHWSYAYMEATTLKMQIAVHACTADSAAVMTAPEGFTSYEWSTGEFGQSIILNDPKEGDTVTCKMYTIPQCSLELVGIVHFDSVSIQPQYDTVCKGEPAILEGKGAHFYEWSDGIGIGSRKVIYPTESKNYIVTGTSNNGCVDIDTAYVTVYDVPQVIASATADLCTTDTIFFTASNGFEQYRWEGPNSFSATKQSPYITNARLNNAGQYNVYATDKNGCVADTAVTVEIQKSPELVITSNTACKGGNITVRSQPAGLTYAWSGPNGFSEINQNLQFVSATSKIDGTYSLTATNTDGCSDTASIVISVRPTPEANFTFDTVCSGTPTTFTNTSAGATSYEWDFGNGEYSQLANPLGVQYSGSYKYNIRLTAYNDDNCADIKEHQLKPLNTPVALYKPGSACVGDTYPLYDLSYVFNDTIISRQWNTDRFGQLPTNNPGLLLTDTIPTEVSLIVSTKYCSDTITDTIIPHRKPELKTFDTLACAPLGMYFSSEYNSQTQYTWDFGDGSMWYDAEAEHYFFNQSDSVRTYTVRQKAITPQGCSDSAESKISLMPNPNAQFIADPQHVCSGQDAHLINTSDFADSIVWIIDDTLHGNDNEIWHTFYNTSGKAEYRTVSLSAWSQYGCKDSATHYLGVFPFPDKGITPGDTAVCNPGIVTFETQSQAAKYEWYFGDGTIEVGSNKIEHVYLNESTAVETYLVRLKVSTNSNCSADFVSQVTVFPNPDALFTIDTNVACSPYTAHITNTSENANSYRWFIDSVEQAKTDEFDLYLENKTEKQKSYLLELEAINAFNCPDRHARTLHIFPEVTAAFTADPLKGCSPLSTSLTNESVGAQSYQWYFGDNTISSNTDAEHTYVNTSDTIQKFPIYLIAESAFGCKDTSDTDTITTYPQPDAKFSASTIDGCSPLETTITNKTSGTNSYVWDYGNGSSNTGNPHKQTYTNIGEQPTIAHITLHATNQYNCTDSAVQPITVYPQPMPNFEPLSAGCSPLAHSFTNTSQYADLYVWDFGDGKMSTVEDPLNTFINSSLNDTTFTVTLKGITHLGCSNTTEKTVTVYATPEPSFLPSASMVLFPETTVSFENTTKGNWDYWWTLGDGTNSNDVNAPDHTYTKRGEFPVILYASGSHCTDSVIHFIVVDGAKIKAEFDSSYAGCPPLPVQFYNKSYNAKEYYWDLGDGTISTTENPSHTYEKPGTYVVELTVTNGDLSDIARSHTVTVYENPVANFSISPKAVSLPQAVINLYNTSDKAESYLWDFGNGDSSDEFQPQYEFMGEGLFDVMLVATSHEGCRDTLVMPGAVQVLQDCGIKFPNAFTPDDPSGGHYDPAAPEISNNIFHPLSVNIEDYKLQIFNRWGEIVFESFHLDHGWDGYYRDQISKSDVYVWKCEATCIGGSTYEKMGTVTLIR